MFVICIVRNLSQTTQLKLVGSKSPYGFFPLRSEDHSEERKLRMSEAKVRIPSPPPPPPQPRTSSLLVSTDERMKKRNLTFNLESGISPDVTDSGKWHGTGGGGNCHHHYIDEPTRIVELEPQPNNVNKVKWKSPANKIADSHEVSSSSEKPEKLVLEPLPEPVLALPVNPASNCYHACRLCVPNHPPLSGYDPTLMGHSALNLQLSDITDRWASRVLRALGFRLYVVHVFGLGVVE